MLIFYLFLKSLVIGAAVAAISSGPVGVLCIRNTLNYGLKAGFAVGIGAALADSIYGLIAGCGMTVISKLLLNHASYIKIFGGLFLFYLSYKELRSKTETKDEIMLGKKAL